MSINLFSINAPYYLECPPPFLLGHSPDDVDLNGSGRALRNTSDPRWATEVRRDEVGIAYNIYAMY